jgi:hypothetical protein
MDGNRFDALTRSLAAPRTRRGVLKTLGAGIAAGLGALGLGNAGAAPGGQGKGKGPQPGRCGLDGQPCKWNRQCCEFAGLVCLDGACGCPEGETLCGGTCRSSEGLCGGCQICATQNDPFCVVIGDAFRCCDTPVGGTCVDPVPIPGP